MFELSGRKRIRVSALITGVLIGIVGVTGLAGAALASQQLGEVQAERAPETVYAETCGYCHGRNVGPIIRGRAMAPATTQYIVRHGLNGMPSFRQTEITPAELDSLAIWLSTSEADPAEMGQ